MALTASAWKGVARMVMPALVKQGLGSNAIINTLRSLGLSYRRIDMLADIREFTGLAKLEGAVLRIGADVIFPQFGMVETGLRRARAYRIFGRVTVEDVETGERDERFVSFYTDTRDTKAGWERSFLEASEGSESRGAQRYIGMQIASVEHQAGWSY